MIKWIERCKLPSYLSSFWRCRWRVRPRGQRGWAQAWPFPEGLVRGLVTWLKRCNLKLFLILIRLAPSVVNLGCLYPIPYPRSWFLFIPDPGCRIQKQQQKRGDPGFGDLEKTYFGSKGQKGTESGSWILIRNTPRTYTSVAGSPDFWFWVSFHSFLITNYFNVSLYEIFTSGSPVVAW